MNLFRSKEQIVRDIARSELDTLFPKQQHQFILEKMTTGDIFEQWVELTVKEMTKLHRLLGLSQRALAIFVKESTKAYAKSYLDGVYASARPLDNKLN